MTINVSEALCTDTAKAVTVRRTSTGLYTDGIYNKGSSSTFKTICSVQQPTPKELQSLPQGERTKDILKFISKKKIRTGSAKEGISADVVLHKGKEYKIISSADWEDYGYTESFGARDK